MKKGGIGLLPEAEKEAAKQLFTAMQVYGIFVVAGGELESWLGHLGASGSKQEWLTSIFEKMGSDPQHADYVRPGTGDVWEFVEQIARWTANPQRLGIPQ